ncbi:helix-turn-helix domain-containing protein [Rhizobium leguminosarum]|uniref:helix-turn-helix domain-containing protein n=1 Tax=Rhizobium TaxID=379 RepID=UPI001030DF44|nr:MULTISPECIES: helix-turn-helix transcriptional regulator [Rhizobium]NEH55524.1 helix-turn-helix domain-containing protein [Rhizobium leguminosarum]TBD89831.1 XRE family transcriptional regulator [Rhizobium ruizarguesonis]
MESKRKEKSIKATQGGYVDILCCSFSFAIMVLYVTPAQIRAARSMSGESQLALAIRARVTRSVLKLLEDPERKRPDPRTLLQLRTALEGKGIRFLDASESFGEGVRFDQPNASEWGNMLRHARALLDLSLDEMAEVSGIGRDTIARIERGLLKRPPEHAIRMLRNTLEQRHVIILPEEQGLGAGVRFRVRQY